MSGEEEEFEGGDSNDGEDTISGPIYGPILIPDVFSHLFKFLGTDDLKNCRLVCISWNYGATPVLKARTLIKIKLSTENFENTEKEESGIMERLKFRPVNDQLGVPDQNKDTRVPAALYPKIVVPVTNLKSIRFLSSSQPEKHFPWQDFCDKIIQSSLTSLEKLELKSDFSQDFGLLFTLVFPKLKKLAIFYDRRRENYLDSIGRAISGSGSFPILEHLRIWGWLFCGILKMEEISPKFAKSFNSLELVGDLDPNGMDALLKFPIPLRKLKIGWVHLDYGDDRLDELPTLLYNVLQKYSPTLEKFSLDVVNVLDWNWQFPKMPALKKFRIGGSNVFKKVGFETSPGNFERVAYPGCFPVLEKLHVYTNAYEYDSRFVFLPAEGCVARTVKEVEVGICTEPRTEADKFEYAALHQRLRNNFPEARKSIIFT